MRVRGLCRVCGLKLSSSLDKKRKICISCWKKGFHNPLLNRKVFVITQRTVGVIRVVDTDRRNALVEFGRREGGVQLGKWKKAEPSWKLRDWIGLNDLRFWTKRRARRCKSDESLWRQEPIL
jgi:hypothetical protein